VVNPTQADQSFPKRVRIVRGADFERVFATKVFAADGVLVVSADRSPVSHTRLGLSVSRKVGNAVVRNRWKRLIREAFRKQKDDLPQGLDLVVRPRAGAQDNCAAVSRSLMSLAKRVARTLSQDKRK
jgi:ribonuclease P protein component